MRQFRYAAASGKWFKGNTHIHSTSSDGGKARGEIAELYHGAGYDFVFLTDHWVSSRSAGNDGSLPLLVCDGVEIDGNDDTGAYYHVVCLGTFTGLEKKRGFLPCLRMAREQGGIIILAHPSWSGNSVDDGLRHGFDGVEVYNHVCDFLNGKGTGSFHWDSMLAKHPNTLGFAADDAHLRVEYPGWNGGWISVDAPACTREAIFDAIRKGRYCFSRGPRIDSISLEGNKVRLKSSPVRFARLIGENWKGSRLGTYDSALISEASFELPADYAYARLEIEDAQGRRAWTNTLFVEGDTDD